MTAQGGEPWATSAIELTEAYATGALSPVDVVTEILGRIDALNGILCAFLAIDPDGALSAARAAEEKWNEYRAGAAPPPVLCGVPVTVKDTIEIAGMPTTYGSRAFSGRRMPDSEIGRRLRASGAVIVGKTNVPEFALSTYTMNLLTGAAANPWDVGRTAGGSSGGAAAAVAAGLGPVAIGTDSAGSIRLPAAYTGVLGVKPTGGLVPTVQRWRASPVRSHNGVLTRTVADASLALRALATPDDPELAGAHLRLTHVDGKRVGVLTDTSVEPDPTGDVAVALAQTGARPVTAQPLPNPPPAELADGIWAYAGDHYAAAERLTPDFWARHAADLTDYAYPVYCSGRRALAWQYRSMLTDLERYAAEVERWFGDYDYALTPVCPAAPRQPESLTAGGLGPRYPLLSAWNLAGYPAVSVPSGFDVDGLPVAVQVVGHRGDDAGTLSVAATLEELRPWRYEWPPVVRDELRERSTR